MENDDLQAAIDLATDEAIAGNVHDAIKFLRAETGIGLREAARMVAARLSKMGKPMPRILASAIQ